MPLHLTCLDEDTRGYMVAEIEADIAAGRLYQGKRLNEAGLSAWPNLLLESARRLNEEWLTKQLQAGDFFNLEETYVRSGKTYTKRVPENAPTLLAECEFNRFYIRGLCVRAIREGVREVVVYRAREAVNPRPSSVEKIGALVNAADLLEDLRRNVGLETALGVPNGVNSGLCVELPQPHTEPLGNEHSVRSM